MKIGDIALTEIHAVSSSHSIASVEKILLQKKVLLVQHDSGPYVGLLTVSDILEKPHRLVIDCITPKPKIDYDTPLEEVVMVMEERSLHFLPVFLRGEFYGIVSYKSLMDRIYEEHAKALNAYEKIFNATHDAILIIHPQSARILQANARFESLLGYSAQDVQTRMCFSALGEDKPPFSKSALSGQMQSTHAKGPQLFQWRMRTKQGAPLWTEILLSQTELWGEPLLIAVIRDITHRKKLEEHYYKIEQFDALRILAGGVAHDFNNHIGGVLNLLELLCLPNADLQDLSELINLAKNRVQKALELTRLLIKFSKEGSLSRTKTDIAQFIQENAELIARGNNISLSFAFPSNLPLLDVSQERFGQAINNLIFNAVQAIGQAAGEIHISARPIQIDADEELPLAPGSYVEITVHDSGPGIPREILPKIFKPYVTSKESGTGLGLAIVYSVVSDHGGYIDVQSDAHSGTIFRMFFPTEMTTESPTTEFPIAS